MAIVFSGRIWIRAPGYLLYTKGQILFYKKDCQISCDRLSPPNVVYAYHHFSLVLLYAAINTKSQLIWVGKVTTEKRQASQPDRSKIFTLVLCSP